MEQRRTNIRDVAKAAGVSITSASQIINGIGKYSEKTIKRVWDTVNELHYTPNPYVRKIFSRSPLERRATGLLQRISYAPSGSEINIPLQRDCIFYFNRACQRHGYSATDYIFRHNLGFCNQLLLKDLIDGAVLCLPHKEIIDCMCGRVPCVLTDCFADPEEAGMPIVNSDAFAAYLTIFRELIQCGRQGGIAFLQGYDASVEPLLIPSNDSVKYCLEAARKTGLSLKAEHIIRFDINPQKNDAVMKGIADVMVRLIREEHVKIIRISNIHPPQKFRILLAERGVNLPEDAVIISSMPEEIHCPGIINLFTDFELMMETAVKVLENGIKNKTVEKKNIFIPYKKIELESIQK